jgi:hypothetical protein
MVAAGTAGMSANVTAFSSAQSFGVGLGGSGFLLVYYIGVLETLVRLGVIDTSEWLWCLTGTDHSVVLAVSVCGAVLVSCSWLG